MESVNWDNSTTLSGYGIRCCLCRLGNVNITGTLTVAVDTGVIVGENSDASLSN